MQTFDPTYLLAKALVGTKVTITYYFLTLIVQAYNMGFTSVDFDPEAPFVTGTGHSDAPELSYDFVGHTVAANTEAEIENLEVKDLPAYIAAHSAR